MKTYRISIKHKKTKDVRVINRKASERELKIFLQSDKAKYVDNNINLEYIIQELIDQDNPYGRFKGIAHYKNGDTGRSLCGGPIDPKQSNYWNNNSNYCKKCEDIQEGWLKA